MKIKILTDVGLAFNLVAKLEAEKTNITDVIERQTVGDNIQELQGEISNSIGYECARSAYKSIFYQDLVSLNLSIADLRKESEKRRVILQEYIDLENKILSAINAISLKITSDKQK